MNKADTVFEHPFHTSVREYIVCLVLFLALYLVSYLFICYLRIKLENDPLFCGDRSDFAVFRISVWICTLTLAVSSAAVLLIPLSIFSNEILLFYPNSSYFRWLNGSLARNLWNSVFLLNNVCMFVLLPFAYFLLESHEPYALYQRYGFMSRVTEACIQSVFLFVFFNVALHLFFNFSQSNCTGVSCFAVFIWWYEQLPAVYSCLSLVGTCLLLACTPVGFGRILYMVDQIVDKPKDVRKLSARVKQSSCDVVVLERRQRFGRQCLLYKNSVAVSTVPTVDLGRSKQTYSEFWKALNAVQSSRRWLCWIRYTAAVTCISILLIFSVSLVVLNILQLITGFRSLPGNAEEFELGKSSLSFLGTAGAVFEVIVTLFFMMASVYGLYSIPLLRGLMPRKGRTPMRSIVLNAAIILLLSSALPVLCKVLGISSFDLLGDYGKLDWLGSLRLLLAYNALFTLFMGCSLSATIGASFSYNFLSKFSSAAQVRRPSIHTKRMDCAKTNGCLPVLNCSDCEYKTL